MQDFKKIEAWQRACTLAVAVHQASRGFSRAGFANLRSQLTRAVDSIAANIVEGTGSATNREFARYLDIAIKSCSETEHHLIKARDHDLMSADTWDGLTGETIEIRKMVYAYRRKVLANVPRSVREAMPEAPRPGKRDAPQSHT